MEEMQRFVYDEGMVNEYGDAYGTCRYYIYTTDKEEAIQILSEYFAHHAVDGVMDSSWAGDIRGKSPREAAEIRLEEYDSGEEFGWQTPQEVTETTEIFPLYSPERAQKFLGLATDRFFKNHDDEMVIGVEWGWKYVIPTEVARQIGALALTV